MTTSTKPSYKTSPKLFTCTIRLADDARSIETVVACFACLFVI